MHDIANVLNSYFVNISKHISESMNASFDHYQYLKGNYANSLFFAPVSSGAKQKKHVFFNKKVF